MEGQSIVASGAMLDWMFKPFGELYCRQLIRQIKFTKELERIQLPIAPKLL